MFKRILVVSSVMIGMLFTLAVVFLVGRAALPWWVGTRPGAPEAVEKRVAAKLAEVAASGAPVKVTQLARAPIPDGENAAVLYRKAFALLSKDDHFYNDVAYGRVDLSKPENAKKAEVALTQSAEARDLIHRAVKMPKCDWQTDWSKGIDASHEYTRLRTCSQLLAFESELRMRHGRTDDALAACRDNFLLAKSANDPIMLAALMRVSISATAFHSLTRVLDSGQPSPNLARSVAAALAKQDPVAAYAEAIKGGRASDLSVFDEVRAAPDPMAAISELTGEKHAVPKPTRTARNKAFIRWMLASDKNAYLEIMNRYIQASAKPYREVAHEPLFTSNPVDKLPEVPPCVLTRLLVSSRQGKEQAWRDSVVAKLGLARAALLLKAYRAEHGSYPETLESLGKLEGKPLPSDPFTGKPFVYHRQGAGFLLYSWGEDLKDDDGGSDPSSKLDNGDIVVKVTR